MHPGREGSLTSLSINTTSSLNVFLSLSVCDVEVLYPLLVEEDQGLPEPPLPSPLGPGLEAERLEPDDDSKFNMIRRQRPA
jgi:hypothetical protein